MIKLLDINLILEHEEVSEDRVLEVVKAISKDGFVRGLLIVEGEHLIVLDGHHRLKALKRLGCRRIPCLIIDYNREDVKVSSWREGVKISKELVVQAGLSGKKLLPKTSRHELPGKQENVKTPLSSLK